MSASLFPPSSLILQLDVTVKYYADCIVSARLQHSQETLVVDLSLNTWHKDDHV